MPRSPILPCLVLLLVTPAATVSAEQVRLTIASHAGPDKAIVHSLLTDVLKADLASAGVTIEYLPIEANYNQFVLNTLSSGTAPDIFYVESSMFEVLAGSGRLHPFSTETSAQAGIIPNLIDAFTSDDVVYALPKDFNSYALLYNKDVFDDAGVAYPNQADDLDDLYLKLEGVVAVLGREGVSGLCVVPRYASGFAAFVLATGWTPIDEFGRTVLDARFERGLRFFVSLVQNGIATPATDIGHKWSGGCFGAERTAIAIEGNWVAAYLRDKAPNLLYGSIPPPVDSQTREGGSLIFTVGWGINRDTRDPVLAEEIVRLLTSDKAQRWVLESGLALPSRESVLESMMTRVGEFDAEFELSTAIHASAKLQYARPFSFGPYGDAWMQPIDEALSAVLTSGVDVGQAIETAQRRYDYLYERHRSAGQ